MQPQVEAAMLSGIFGIVGVAIGTFQEEIRSAFHLASRKNNYLLDLWNCTWDTQAPAIRPQIRDTVTITHVHGNLIKGKGSTPGWGRWDLEGRASDLAVCFTYLGKEKQHLLGSTVLKKVNNDEMTGVWAQYSEDGDVLSGITSWRRG